MATSATENHDKGRKTKMQKTDPMRVFVVHAHPEPRSFNSAMCRQTVATLTAAGHDVRVSDLYAQGFNPVASDRDFTSRQDPDYLVYALEQRQGVKTGTIAPDIQHELDNLLWCDLLILNFPVFWFSVPAILKGWIDRVFVSGAVYGGKAFYDRGRLAGRKALVTASIGGQRHMFGADAVHGPLDDMLRPLLRGTLAYAGFEVLQPYVAYHVPYVDDATRQGFLEDLRKHVSDVAGLPRLTFPSLDDFDERLLPKHGRESDPKALDTH